MGTVIRDNDGGNHKIISPNYTNSKPVTIGIMYGLVRMS